MLIIDDAITLYTNEYVYYFAIEKITCDGRKIADYLGISYKNYIDILIKYNAYLDDENDYIFDDIEDAERCLNSKELEPYIIMNKLIGE